MDRCVYFHLTPDTHRLFYIGMGSLKRAHEFNAGRNKPWKNIVEKSGKPTVLIIAKNLTSDEAVKWEKFWIKHHGLDRLANISPGGDGILGFAVSDETRLKISRKLKGRTLPKETVEKVAAALRGRKRPPETVEKIAKINTGKKRSQQARDNMRNAQLGKIQSEEHRKKISISLKGRKQNPEHARFKGEKQRDSKIYNFYHEKHGLVSCTKKELSDRYNLGSSGIYAVASGRRISHLGWSIVPLA